MSKIRKSLHILEPKEDLGDFILVHRMSRLLDRPTREAWETSRINITELPTFEEFETFLTARVRALQIASDTPAGSHKPTSTSFPTSKVMKAYHSSSVGSSHSKPTDSSNVTHSSRISQFLCTYWGKPHFIVACSTFKRLDEQQRRKFAMEKPLCCPAALTVSDFTQRKIVNRSIDAKPAMIIITRWFMYHETL